MEYNTKLEVAALSNEDPELTRFIQENGMPQPPTIAPATSQEEPELQPKNDEEYVVNIPMRDGFQSELRIHKPISRPSASPLVVLVFGGSFVMGDNKQLSPMARKLVSLYGATVVNLSYRLAPEYKFPYAPNDVFDSLVWISKNFASLSTDPAAGFILGGASAGANLAAVTAQKWLNRKLAPPLTGVWVNIPVLLEHDIVPESYRDLWFSREQNADSLFVNKAGLEYMMLTYAPDVTSPDFSPFNADNPHKGLPPVYIQVCGQDPLRDDGLIYEKVLRGNGVKTKLDVYPGVPHAHIVMSSLKSAKKANLDSIAGFGWLLGKQVDEQELKKEADGFTLI